MYVCNDLGQILECGFNMFNLASNKSTFLFKRACPASYLTAYASVKYI